MWAGVPGGGLGAERGRWVGPGHAVPPGEGYLQRAIVRGGRSHWATPTSDIGGDFYHRSCVIKDKKSGREDPKTTNICYIQSRCRPRLRSYQH